MFKKKVPKKCTVLALLKFQVPSPQRVKWYTPQQYTCNHDQINFIKITKTILSKFKHENIIAYDFIIYSNPKLYKLETITNKYNKNLYLS